MSNLIFHGPTHIFMIIPARSKSFQIIFVGQVKSNRISVMEVRLTRTVFCKVAMLVDVGVGVTVEDGDGHALLLRDVIVVGDVVLPPVEGKAAGGFNQAGLQILFCKDMK